MTTPTADTAQQLAAAVIAAATDDAERNVDHAHRTSPAVWRSLVATLRAEDRTEQVALQDATRLVCALPGGPDALGRLSGDPYPITWDCTFDLTNAEHLALYRHVSYEHGWENFDGVFTYEQALAAHAFDHEQAERGDNMEHAADDIVQPSSLPWAHIDVDDHGEWFLRDGRQIIARCSSRTGDTLTLGSDLTVSVFAVTGFRKRAVINAG